MFTCQSFGCKRTCVKDAQLANLVSFACPPHPCGQVLHVLRHLVSYTVLAPARLGDWPTVLVNAQALCLTAFLLLLTVSPRSGRLWAAWRR